MTCYRLLAGRCGLLGLAAALVLGAALRLLWGADIEYKLDEAWTFRRSLEAGRTEPFPTLGMPTSAGFRNPPLSVWVFVGLSKTFNAKNPVALARAIELLSIGALLLLVVFVWRLVPREEREPWLWAIVLAALNPIAILYQRKIWPPSVLPLFSVLLLICWYRRDQAWGAFALGLLGACMGQIHLAAFFFAGGLAGWALLFDRQAVRWRWWLLGSFLGGLFLIPWLAALATSGWDHPARASRIIHVIEGKFWLRWLEEPLGVSLAYALGDDFGDFLRYPLISGQPTYLVGALHALMLLAGGAILLRGAFQFVRLRLGSIRAWAETKSPTGFMLGAAFCGFGILMTVTAMPIHRHYLFVAFPLTFVWLAWLALPPGGMRLGRGMLMTLCLAQGLLAFAFLDYIHHNQRIIRGEYQLPYRAQTPLQKTWIWDDAKVELDMDWKSGKRISEHAPSRFDVASP
jgi:hypothetical protein